MLSLLLCSTALAAEVAPPEVVVTLLADTTSVTAGQSLELGVRITLPEGWHVYWHNPGETGLSTTVDFSGPDGFTAGPLRWPGPERFLSPGDIVSYGYDAEAVLFLPLTAPASLPDGGASTLTASVSWLACREICIFGSAEPEVTLPHAAPSPANDTALADWRARLPTEFTGQLPGQLPGQPDVSAVDPKARTLTLTLPGSAMLHFFPANSEVVTETIAGESLTVELRALEVPTRLQGVLSARTADQTRYYTIDLPWQEEPTP